MPTYRSKLPITSAARRTIAYETLIDIFRHLLSPSFSNVNVIRTELMPDNFVEVDTNVALPANQVDHFGLTGPV